jgi:ribosomal protein S18 acetylase RimI-like enzyme
VLGSLGVIATLQPRRIVFVDTIAVAPDYQRRGIGRAVVQAAIAWGEAHGAQDLELTVWAFNAGAIAFYERLGLAVSSFRKATPLDGKI